jgi:hypothetical protein
MVMTPTKEKAMTFKPKFPSYRRRLATFAIMAAFYGALVLLLGHEPCNRGKDALVIAGILALAAAVPESPAKKPQAEKYSFTPGP